MRTARKFQSSPTAIENGTTKRIRKLSAEIARKVSSAHGVPMQFGWKTRFPFAVLSLKNSATGMSSHFNNRLAVCSWSLQPKSPEELVEILGQVGLKTVQLALDPLRENPDVWGKTKDLFREKGIIIVSGMFGTIGEDYTTMDTIKATGGVVPDAVWPDNWKNIQEIADIAKSLGVRLVTFHAGFLPHDHKDPQFKKLGQPDRTNRGYV